ncbi:MICAL-like protein 1 [Prorops nasuta]|uniref:MICAL-like protein 1 n=1 Tax=Prorops nasuta TaxID=863751 RepID=UPI0034CFE7FC
MGERRGTKALELWCRRITDGYPGVSVHNMTTSWRDGLAFCAMIHHFRPDLIDFKSLDKNDVYGNNELAFRTAQEHLGIPALLDAEDMASCSVPDRLSILTYLSQFYQVFGGSSPSRLAVTRTAETTDGRIAPVAESPQPKVESRLGMRRDNCAVCSLPVFLAEKLVVSRTAYHRTCFRCARCRGQLMPGNYYETEEGQFCCETCPDEEVVGVPLNFHQEGKMKVGETDDPEILVTSRQTSLSDEEKTERNLLSLQTNFRPLEDPAAPDLITQTAQMRLDFISGHLRSERPIETSKGSISSPRMMENFLEKQQDSLLKAEVTDKTSPPFPDGDENKEEEVDEGDDEYEEEGEYEEEEEEEGEVEERRTSLSTSCTSNFPSSEEQFEQDSKDSRNKSKDMRAGLSGQIVNNQINSKLENKTDKRLTATSALATNKDINVVDNMDDTKEPSDQMDESDKNISLVQKRLRIFEIQESKNDTQRESELERKSTIVRARLEPQEKASNVLDDSSIKLKSNHSEKKEKSGESLDVQEVLTARISMKKVNVTTDPSDSTEKFDTASSNPFENAMSNESSMDDSVEVKEASNISLSKAKGVDLSVERVYPEDLNPFKSDDEQENIVDNYKTALNSSQASKVSTNPFSSDDEEESNTASPPKPAVRSSNVSSKTPELSISKRKLAAPKISLNPFWSDDEEEQESENEARMKSPLPVPKPRTIRHSQESDSVHRKSDLHRGGMYASNTSITSSESSTTPGGTYRKKKPAPQPPIAKELFPSGPQSISPRGTIKARKAKPAPPPPLPTSTPHRIATTHLILQESPIVDIHDTQAHHKLNMWEDQKINKDEANRSKQGMTSFSSGEDKTYKSHNDKSIQGKWKRKKGPAPPRPIPHRRKIKVMSLKDVKLELEEIEVQQQGLERQGVRLEQLIREKTESGPQCSDTSLSADVEELILELFTLVNEKNELFRRQAELMLLRRQQRLEEEHIDVEYQIRCLMCQPEATKTDFDKQREETLIQRLVEIVERRNEIVECLEMDRRREVEEDRSINKQMGLFAAKNKAEILGISNESCSPTKKKGKLKEKLKDRKLLKKNIKKDADKDVDETELKLKRHSKKRWF